MPISSDEFKKEKTSKGTGALRARILKFLQEHKDQAFTQDEIGSALYMTEKMGFSDSTSLMIELVFLAAANRIESKEIVNDGQIKMYYRSV